MSTRASVQIVDGNDCLYFYQHSDGYPEGLGETLKSVLTLPGVISQKNDIEYLAGMIMMEVNRGYVEQKQRMPDMMPALGVHGDEAYTYRIDANTLELKTLKGAKDMAMVA